MCEYVKRVTPETTLLRAGRPGQNEIAGVLPVGRLEVNNPVPAGARSDPCHAYARRILCQDAGQLAAQLGRELRGWVGLRGHFPISPTKSANHIPSKAAAVMPAGVMSAGPYASPSITRTGRP